MLSTNSENLFFFRFDQSCQFTFIFVERSLCERNSKLAQIDPFDQPIKQQRDKDERASRGRRFCGSHSRRRAREGGVRFFRSEDEDVMISSFIIKFVTGIATGLSAPENEVSMDVIFAGTALEGGLLASRDSVGSKDDCILE